MQLEFVYLFAAPHYLLLSAELEPVDSCVVLHPAVPVVNFLSAKRLSAGSSAVRFLLFAKRLFCLHPVELPAVRFLLMKFLLCYCRTTTRRLISLRDDKHVIRCRQRRICCCRKHWLHAWVEQFYPFASERQKRSDPYCNVRCFPYHNY